MLLINERKQRHTYSSAKNRFNKKKHAYGRADLSFLRIGKHM